MSDNKPIKVLFAAAEALPFAATGGLGDVIGSLPKALADKGDLDVRVIMPLYADIPAKYKDKMVKEAEFICPLAWRQQQCDIYSLAEDGVTFYFVANRYYFTRQGLYSFYDDGERFAFFSRAVCEALPHLGFIPDILHAHDWQAALVPVFLRLLYGDDPKMRQVKTVFTIHNIEYQGKYDTFVLGDLLGLAQEHLPILEYNGQINLVKAAIAASDLVSTVSPSYAKELCYSYFAHGLQDIVKAESAKMRGILNGIDEASYDPKSDPAIFANYSWRSLEQKAANKLALQQMTGLPVATDTPIVAVVSRLVASKGLDLITCVMDEMMDEKLQMIVLGCGDEKYEEFFRWKSYQYPAKLKALITYDRDLSRKIYAGADLLLMPSNIEPCGLAQMIASRYGTVPVVRAVGGLKDSVKDYAAPRGNGFVFNDYNAHDMLHTLKRALELYRDPPLWGKLAASVMRRDFSWRRSADRYLEMYRQLIR